MSGCSFTLGAALQAAVDKDCRVRVPKANQLFLDIDSDEDMKVFDSLRGIFCEYESGVVHFDVKPSKSGLPHRHVVVTLARDVTALERIALQAMLGSDRKHELLSYLAHARGMQVPTLFFEKEPA